MNYLIFDLLLSLVVVATTMHFFAVQGVERRALYNVSRDRSYLTPYIFAMVIYGVVIIVALIIIVVHGKILSVTVITSFLMHALIHISVFYYERGIDASLSFVRVVKASFLESFNDITKEDLIKSLDNVKRNQRENKKKD